MTDRAPTTPNQATNELLPLLNSQYWMWLRVKQHGDVPASIMRCRLDFDGPVDPQRLAWAWATAVGAIESHNIELSVVDGVPRQRVVERAHPVTVVAADDHIDVVELTTTQIGMETAWDSAVVVHSDSSTQLCAAAHHLVNDASGALALFHLTAHLYRTGDREALAAQQGGLRSLLKEDQGYLNGRRIDTDAAYWAATLAGFVPPQPRKQATWSPPTDILGTSWLMDTTVARALATRMSDLGVPWHTYAFASTGILTARHRASSDVVVMVPVSQRRTKRSRMLPALYTNFLPLRLDAHPRTPTKQFLSDVADRMRRLILHQGYPSSMARALVPTDTGGAPLGPSVNVLPARAPFDFGHVNAHLTVTDFGPVDDLQFTFAENQDGSVLVSCHVNPSVHDLTYAEQSLAEMRVLLESLADTGDFPRHQGSPEGLLVGPESPIDQTALFARLDDVVRTDPGRIAVVTAQGSVDYGTLARAVVDRTTTLRAAGVRPGHAVVHLGHRTLDTLVNILALWQVGATYIPVGVDWPPSRVSDVVTDCTPHLMIVSDGVAPGIVESTPGVPGLRTSTSIPPEAHAVGSGLNRWARADVPYVIYTSGSTGRPKGAAVTWEGMTNHLSAKQDLLAASAGDALAVTAPPTFDISIWQFILPAFTGGCAVLLGDDEVQAVHTLANRIDQTGITVLELVPGLLGALFEHWRHVGRNPESLRVVMSTGEALPPSLCSEWEETLRNVRLVNAYGPTECSDDVTHWEVTHGAAASGSPVLIGSAIRNAHLYVLDAWLRPVAVGETGELYIGGPVVGLGYLGRATLTATSFIADPFSRVPGSRMYRTGDLVRLHPGGALEFATRVDGQVKVSGHRIEIGEVEAALGRVPGVRRGSVVAVGSGSSARLAGFVVGDATLDTITETLGSLLPPYMVPLTWRFVDSLPSTPNGKVDRDALAATVARHGTRRDEFSDEVAELIGHQMAVVLGVDHVGPHDDFIELGGNSLAAIRLVGLLRAKTSLPINLEDIFLHPTPAGLARCRTNPPSAFHTDAGLSAMPPVATPGQRRMWLLQEFLPDDWSYNVALRIDNTGPDADRFVWHVREAIRNHDGLRTRLVNDTCGLLQQVVAPDDVPWERVHVVHNLGAAPDDATLIRLAADPVPLTTDIPVRLHECRHPGGVTLLLVVHHAACDGWSLRHLAQELDDTLAGVQVAASPDRASLVDYARWMASPRLRESAWYAEQLDYWTTTLADTPGPFRWPGTSTHAASRRPGRRPAATLALELSSKVFADIKRTSREVGGTPFMVIQTAVAAAVGAVVGRDEVLIGTAVHGREPQFEGTVGFFANTVLLRTPVDPTAPVGVRLESSRRALLGGIAHGTVPFDEVLAHVRRDTPTLTPDVVQVMISYQREERFHQFDARSLGTGAAKFDIALECEERGTVSEPSLHINLEYATDVIPEWVAHTLVRGIEAQVTALTSVPLSSPAPTAPGNGADPGIATLLNALDEGFRCNPDGVAAIHDGAELTHAQLHERTVRWAEALRRRGLGEGAFIPVVVHRSLKWLCAFIAVLRCGAAVVPIDAQQPSRRLRHHFTCVGATHVLGDASFADSEAAEGVTVLTPADLDATDSDIGDLPRPRPDSVAYVIFTSGSTGRPKAVTVSHRSAATFVSNIREVARSNTPTRVVQFGSTGFDAIIWEMGVSLGLGGTLLLPKPAERSPGPGLAEYLETSRATHILVPPSVLGTMPSSMSVPTEFFVGGEALRQSLIDRWAGRIHMRNVYGPTETTVVCLVGEQLAVSDPPALGSPVADCVVHVLDKRLAPVQAGEVGELYLTGEMVSWGYITDPPLTACRFVASPYGPPGTRMYGTGDLVRLQRDGGLVHVGRIDQQVKVRGNRIELTEVVTSLESLPYVEVAAVLPIDEGPSLALVGFVKYVDNLPIDSDAVLARLRDELPAAAVPHRLVALDSLPMTINQKVDTKALRAMYARLTHTEDAPADLGTEAAQSDDDVTDRIVAAYRQVLRRADVDPTTDFVTAGGDSISAVSLVAHLRADGIYLSPHDILSRRTPSRLSLLARAAQDDDPATHRGRITLPPVAQWYASQVDGTVGFTHSVALGLPTGLTIRDVEAALHHLAATHPILSARLASESPVVLQVGEPGPLPLTRGLPVGPPDAKPSAWLENPLDPAAGALWRTHLVHDDQERPQVLWIQVHHYVVDGVSWRILLGDLDRLLGPNPAVRTGKGGPTGVSFRRWSSLLWQSLDSEPRDRIAARWARLMPAGEDAQGGPRSRVAALRTSWWDAAASAPVVATDTTTAEHLLLAAFATALAQRSLPDAGDTLLIRLEGHGRDSLPGDLDVARTVGWFTVEHPVAIPVRSPTGLPASALEILDRTRDALAALPSRRATYGLLRWGPDGHPTLATEPRVAFNFLGRLDHADAEHVTLVQDVRPDREAHAPALHNVALTAAVIVTPEGSQVRLDWEWDTSVVSSSEIDCLEASFATALANLAGTPTTASTGPLRSWRGDIAGALTELGLDLD